MSWSSKGWLFSEGQGDEHDNTASRAEASPFRVQFHNPQARRAGQTQGWQLGAAESLSHQVSS